MFIKDCNTCWCNEDGTSFFCTRKVCVQELHEDESQGEVKLEELRVIKRDCRPDEVFEMDCNMCRCNPDGKSFSCTRRACLDVSEEDVKNDTTVSSRTGEDNKKNATTLSRKTREVNNKNEQAKNCIPNQEFRLDCNKCLCDTTGQNYSCTRMDCTQQNNNNHQEARTKRETESAPETPDIAKSDATKDKPESSPLNVTSIADTEDTTGSPMSDPNFRCNPGEQFKRGCNDCSCSADGKSFFCTLRLCDQDITPPPS